MSGLIMLAALLGPAALLDGLAENLPDLRRRRICSRRRREQMRGAAATRRAARAARYFS